MPRIKRTEPEAAPSAPVAVLEPGPALPGEAVADDAAIEQAVANINRMAAQKGLETARAIGEYVLSAFFGGDPENFRKKGGGHASFRKLAEREDLHVSYSFVWKACAVVDQLRLLPPDVAERLPLSHHQLLLPVRDDQAKVTLARGAAEKGLPKRAFEERVRKVREKETEGSKAGRPPLPAFAKAFGKLESVVRLARSEEVTVESFRHFPRDKVQTLLLDVEDHISALQRLAARVRERLDEQAAAAAPEPEVVYDAADGGDAE